MKSQQTLIELVKTGAEDATAIAAPDRPSLTYGQLRQLVETTIAGLNKKGLGRGDRVAMVLPNGPEMASAFIAVGAGMTTAPLNPRYREDEFKFYLEDLNAKALLVEQGSDSAAVAAANTLGIPVITLIVPDGSSAGYFELAGETIGKCTKDGPARPDDTALVLHTSGTTSRPKIVPLSQKNICVSAANIARTLQLVPDDRCLNIMPLFHIHGLIAAVLATLRAGASIYCTPGFNALKFFPWHDDFMPSWYTAVPTMHQAILARAERNKTSVDKSRLRFIRSSSASLPPQIMTEMVKVWGSPVIEAYGMTEAAHQMACNPLPPGIQKPGSVGLAAGPEVAIMDEAGGFLQTGIIGEIVIKGDNVTSGYENNPKANDEGFTNGWFRTGDQGLIDKDGYLHLTGRLKEIINRGGEKISPREVDEVIMNHPAVEQVVTFAVKHAKLGENIAAAIVLKEGMEVDEKSIRDFAALSLADFKVPRTIVFPDEIPKGATGKLQRIGLAEKLGLQS